MQPVLKAGSLDERIAIQQRTGTQNAASGAYEYSWSTLATVWADVYEVMGGERWAQGLDIARRPISVTIRYRDDITSDMRVQWRGETYRITRGPTEMGRRKATRMVCELNTTEGDEA